MPVRFVPFASIGTLIAAFIIDALTPERFVAAILLDAPVVLSSLGGSRRLTFGLVIAGLVSDALAAYINHVQSGMPWDSLAIADRLLAALSIVFVGYLSTAVHENARRAGLASAQEARAMREARVGAALERVRTSLSAELVMRAIVREAIDVLDASAARFLIAGESRMLARSGSDEHITTDETRPSPDVVSLAARTFNGDDAIGIERNDALGRLVLDTLGGDALIAVPIADRDERFGTLFATIAPTARMAERLATARYYGHGCADALVQARLFEELGRRNEALEERSGVIRDLVYALSHDLRTPLAALGMTLRQAQAGTYGELPSAYQQIVTQSIIAVDDVATLADTLLLVARFESADRHPQREAIDVAELVRQLVGEFSAVAHARGIHIASEPKNSTIVADYSDIRRAIANLLANALEHTPAGGTVTIRSGVEASEVVVLVEDDGPGIALAARAKLFTRFARGEGRAGGGSGLGLYIVARVAQESGGSVRFEAREPHGSRFTLRFPEGGK